ncbi:MAG: ABATE domain-containing protein, partial [Chloroflexota bacterium]|nr:ABATE domain-containing protein [Chloroflexota bacterium]
MAQDELVGLEFVAGALCLDFANTLRGRYERQPRELLGSYGDFVRFGRQSGIIEGPQAERLLAEAARRPADAAGAWRRAVAVREAI